MSTIETEVIYLCIAEHYIKVTFIDTKYNNISLIRSSLPFSTKPVPDEDLLYTLTVDDTLKPIPKRRLERIRDFESGNGQVIVDEINEGGYQFIYKDTLGKDCAMFQTNKDFNETKVALNGTFDMRSFGIHNAMMMSFALAGSFKQTIMIHSSLVRYNGYGYAFHAPSGTGKSTQVSMWLRHIPGCDLMNDDNPIIRIIDGKPYIYGSPWSGKTPCYRNIKAPLGALTRIDQADHNWVEKLKPVEAFTSILPSCSGLKWDVREYRNLCDIVTIIASTTNAFILHCLPNKEAAEVCCAAIAVKDPDNAQQQA